MPIKVRCPQCGKVLLDVKQLVKHGSLGPWAWYELLYRELNGKCSGCGRELPRPEVYALGMKVDVLAGRF